MTDDYVIRIKENSSKDDYSFEEIKPGSPEHTRYEKHEQEYKKMLLEDDENPI